jgi:hypothetical protein
MLHQRHPAVYQVTQVAGSRQKIEGELLLVLAELEMAKAPLNQQQPANRQQDLK